MAFMTKSVAKNSPYSNFTQTFYATYTPPEKITTGGKLFIPTGHKILGYS